MTHPGERSTIHIVDSDLDVRRALKASLVDLAPRVKAWASAESFLTERSEREPGCLVLDLILGGTPGLGVLKRLPEDDLLRIVVLTGRGDVGSAVLAVRRGAIDVLEKPHEGEALRKRVQWALLDSEASSQRLVTARSVATRLETLTHAEREVAHRVVQGWTTQEIASDLHRSDRTIGNQRQSVLRKMAVRNTTALAHDLAAAGYALDRFLESSPRP